MTTNPDIEAFCVPDRVQLNLHFYPAALKADLAQLQVIRGLLG